jgi:hypothetical protein
MRPDEAGMREERSGESVSAESVTVGGLTFGRGMMGSGGSDVWHDREAQ